MTFTSSFQWRSIFDEEILPIQKEMGKEPGHHADEKKRLINTRTTIIHHFLEYMLAVLNNMLI